MLMLIVLAGGCVNMIMLARLWRDGRLRRAALRERLDTLAPAARPTRHHAND